MLRTGSDPLKYSVADFMTYRHAKTQAPSSLFEQSEPSRLPLTTNLKGSKYRRFSKEGLLLLALVAVVLVPD